MPLLVDQFIAHLGVAPTPANRAKAESTLRDVLAHSERTVEELQAREAEVRAQLQAEPDAAQRRKLDFLHWWISAQLAAKREGLLTN